MMRENGFSIIMPVYNAEKTLNETINSVINQNYDNYELIIIDDGSDDNSKKIIEKYLKNKKITYIYQLNSGVSSARNKAIEYAKNDFIIFIDSDDMLCDDALNICNKKINEVNADIYSFGYQKNMNKKIEDLCVRTFETKNFAQYMEVLYSNYLFNQLWNKVYKRKIIKEKNIKFDESISIAEDLKFNLHYCKNSSVYANDSKTIYKYKLSNTGLGFTFRLESGYIKIDIDLLLKNILISKNENILYANKIILKDIISFYSKIIDSRNKMNKVDKIVLIKHIQNKYKNDIENIENLKGSYNIILKILLFNNAFCIYCVACLANVFDKINKKRKFGI